MREVAMTAVFSFENTIQQHVSEKELNGFFKVMASIPKAMELITSEKLNLNDGN